MSSGLKSYRPEKLQVSKVKGENANTCIFKLTSQFYTYISDCFSELLTHGSGTN